MHIFIELAHLKKERNFTIFFMPLGVLLVTVMKNAYKYFDIDVIAK